MSGVVFFVVSFFSCASLHFSREGVHADSTLQSEEIILLPRLTTSFGVLTTLRIVCLFGLVWGTIGLNWVTYAGPGCDERLTKVLLLLDIFREICS